MNQENLTDHDLLISLLGEVKGLREDIRRVGSETDKKLGDHETRVRALEQNRWTIAGASTVLGAGASLLVSYLLK